MANDLTSTPHLWIVTDPAVLSETPVIISRIIYIPGATDNDLLFRE